MALPPCNFFGSYIYSQKPQSDGTKMMLVIADELDYLITKDRAVLHDLFMLTTYPFSRCIILGVANATDLADRFVPKLQPLNCKPMVITFHAYSKDQILKILQERLMLYKSFLEICKLTQIPPVGSFEVSSVCKVLSDQGLLKLSGQSRDMKSKRVT